MNVLNSSGNANEEHEVLLAEMELIERLPTQERLKQAKRRRADQLKKWADYERECQMQEYKQSQHQQQPFRQIQNQPQHYQQQSVQQNVYNAPAGIKTSNIKSNRRVKNTRSIKFQDHVVLLDAIMRKDYDEVERLLGTGVSPNSANEDGLTAIHQCCIDDSDDLLKLLIRYGADVNVCDNDLWTPLHAAATCANLEICKILIENNADLLAVNTDGNMPYDICDDEVCLEYIESEMARRGVTQQTIDMKRSETEMRMLEDLKQMCFLTSSNNVNFTPSSSLNSNSFLNSSTNMNERRSILDLNAKDANGATLAHIACANGYTSVLEFLFIDCMQAAQNGLAIIPPLISVRDKDGWTPLHVATFWGHQRAIEILLEQGANIEAKTNNNETVLDLCDDQEVRDFIIQKSKEIESKHQQAAAAAAARVAMQMKLQMISNRNNIVDPFFITHNIGPVSYSSGSINNLNSMAAVNNSSNSNINSSTRSLKRTSTGVSRSSSVRRSSFRDKEKAARKLDTSFKEALYASELTTTNEAPSPEVEAATRGQIARIYSNGSIALNSNSTAATNLGTANSTLVTLSANNLNTNTTSVSSNASVMSSYASSNSLPIATESASSLINTNHSNHNHHNNQNNNNNHNATTNTTLTQQNNNQNQTTMTIISQIAMGGHADDVIYKFKSSKVIGGKTSADDAFGDIESDTPSGPLAKCYNFLRVCCCFKFY